jgi:tetratricopeptide (TPR) repeat protein
MLPILPTALLLVAGRATETIGLTARVDADGFDSRERALLMMGLASAHTHQGNFPDAYAVLDEVVELAQAAKLPGLAVAALGSQLVASIVAGKETVELTRRLMDATEVLDQPQFTSFAEMQVGSLDLIEGRFGEASRHFRRATRVDSGMSVQAPGYAIVAALLAGDEDAAEAAARNVMTISVPVAYSARAAYSWNIMRSLALWYAWTGDLDEARRVESRALAFQHAKPMPLADADHLVTLAAIAFFDGDAERAALLLGVGRRAMADHSSWRGHDAGPLYLHFRERCAEALGRERADRLRNEGRTRQPDEVLAEARADLVPG